MPNSGYGESNGGYNLIVPGGAYNATLADNGKWVSSYGATAAFDVTLPAINTLPLGWCLGILCNQSVGFAGRFRANAADKLYLPQGVSAAGGSLTQTGSGRSYGGTLQVIASAANTWWWGIGYPYDWATAA